MDVFNNHGGGYTESSVSDSPPLPTLNQGTNTTSTTEPHEGQASVMNQVESFKCCTASATMPPSTPLLMSHHHLRQQPPSLLFNPLARSGGDGTSPTSLPSSTTTSSNNTTISRSAAEAHVDVQDDDPLSILMSSSFPLQHINGTGIGASWSMAPPSVPLFYLQRFTYDNIAATTVPTLGNIPPIVQVPLTVTTTSSNHPCHNHAQYSKGTATAIPNLHPHGKSETASATPITAPPTAMAADYGCNNNNNNNNNSTNIPILYDYVAGADPDAFFSTTPTNNDHDATSFSSVSFDTCADSGGARGSSRQSISPGTDFSMFSTSTTNPFAADPLSFRGSFSCQRRQEPPTSLLADSDIAETATSTTYVTSATRYHVPNKNAAKLQPQPTLVSYNINDGDAQLPHHHQQPSSFFACDSAPSDGDTFPSDSCGWILEGKIHLPPQPPQPPPKHQIVKKGRFTIVLSLEGTLVLMCYPTTNGMCGNLDSTIRPNAVLTPHTRTGRGSQGGDESTNVYYRPHLAQFLSTISQNFDIAIFSTCEQDYVDALLDVMDPSGQVFPNSRRYYRQHCTVVLNNQEPPDPSQPVAFLAKNLETLGIPLSDMVLVDDTPDSGVLQPRNLLLLPTWSGTLADTALLQLMDELMRISTQHTNDLTAK